MSRSSLVHPSFSRRLASLRLAALVAVCSVFLPFGSVEASNPSSVAVFGDSLGVGAASALSSMAASGTKVISLSKNGFGMTGSDAAKAVASAAARIGRERAGIVFVVVGTNDASGVSVGGVRAKFGTVEWREAYASMIIGAVRAFSSVGATVFLVDVPGNAKGSYARAAMESARAQRMAAARIGVPVVSIGRVASALSGGGDAVSGLRSADGIHLTAAGYREMAGGMARAANARARAASEGRRSGAERSEMATSSSSGDRR